MIFLVEIFPIFDFSNGNSINFEINLVASFILKIH